MGGWGALGSWSFQDLGRVGAIGEKSCGSWAKGVINAKARERGRGEIIVVADMMQYLLLWD